MCMVHSSMRYGVCVYGVWCVLSLQVLQFANGFGDRCLVLKKVRLQFIEGASAVGNEVFLRFIHFCKCLVQRSVRLEHMQ